MSGKKVQEKSSFRFICLIVIGLLLMPLMMTPLQHAIFAYQLYRMDKLNEESNQLTQLVFTPGDFAKLTFRHQGRECWYQGNMYDIHSVMHYKDRVVVLAINDQAESGLILAFLGWDLQDEPADSGSAVVCFMPYFFVNSHPPLHNRLTVSLLEYSHLIVTYTDPDFRICSPPPQLLTFS